MSPAHPWKPLVSISYVMGFLLILGEPLHPLIPTLTESRIQDVDPGL